MLDRTQDFDALLDRVDRISPTGAANMENATGRASFTGVSTVGVDASFDVFGNLQGDAILIGNSVVDVNFNNGAVGGAVTNLFGVDDRGNIDEYSGEFDLSGGSIGVGRHNAFSSDFDGTIRGNGDTITSSGTMDGLLLGNPDVRALDMAGVGSGSLNGSNVTVIVTVTAERD